MLSQFGPSTWWAIAIGAGVAVLGFLPVAAYRYRTAGRLRAIDLVMLLAVTIYAMALWTYTLVPLPEGSFRCVRSQLVPFQFVEDILAVRAQGQGWRQWVRSPVVLQAAFNVVLFLPFGFFLRVLAKWGAVLATVLGGATSLVIELTQRTGLWGLYPCAWRVFDVDDLILNTSGALMGSLIAVPFVWLLERSRPVPPTMLVTRGRRLTGMLADWMLVSFIGFGITLVWRASALYLLEWDLADLPSWFDQLLGWVPAALVQLWAVLGHGRTLGEAVVQLRPVAPDRRAGRLLVKYLAGVGGYLILSGVVPDVAGLFLVATFVAVFCTSGRRGLSHALAGMALQIEEPRSVRG